MKVIVEVDPDKRRMLPRRPGISWTVGAKVEAMDYLKKWSVQASAPESCIGRVDRQFISNLSITNTVTVLWRYDETKWLINCSLVNVPNVL